MAEIKAIIFDFDGTLVESVDAYVDVFYSVFKKYGFNVEKKKIMYMLGYTYTKIIRDVVGENCDKYEEIVKEYLKNVRNDEFISKIKIKRGVKEILRFLKEKGVLLFIISGSNKQIMKNVLEENRISSYFLEIISTKEDGFKEKPEPDAINYIKEKYNLSCDEIIFVGDGVLDYKMASNAGIRFIGICGSCLDEKCAFENNFPLIYSITELKRLFTKIIIALVGMPGSGKTTARDIITGIYGFPYIRFGDITDEYIKKKNMEKNEESERKIRELLREKYGMEAFAKLNFQRICELLEKSRVIIIDGLYSWEEYLFLKENICDAEIILISLISHKNQRYFRLINRKERRLSYEDTYARDLRELKKLNKCFPIAMADYFLYNVIDKSFLKKQIKHIMTQILLL